MKKENEEVPAQVSSAGELWAQEQMPSYYYGEFRTPSRVFADEVDKHWMLRELGAESKSWNVEVLAFSLTDDKLQVLLCDENEQPGESPKDFLQTLGTTYDGHFGEGGKCQSMVREHLKWETVPTGNVLQKCSDIHARGTEEGYTEKVTDYWWSSYVSYCGIYDWEFVRKDLLLEQFSVDPDEAYTLCTGRSRRGRHRSCGRPVHMGPQPAAG